MNPFDYSHRELFPAEQEDASLEQFIRTLPKAEMHLHIEGSLDWSLLQSVHPFKYGEPPMSWQEDFRFSDFASFEAELLGYASDWFTSPERYHECAKHTFRHLQAQNVKYLETSFASGVTEFFDVPGEEIVEAVKAAVPEGMHVRLFMGIHHAGYNERMKPMLEDALTWEGLDGIDLHGAEDDPELSWAPDYWHRAREAGKYTKAHAGEFCGPDMVRYVIDELGVKRIEHGMRAIEDDTLVRRLADEEIVLDVCPISNMKLMGYPDITEQPLRKFLEAGVKCTINTDDPISFGNTLNGEYLYLARKGNFTKEELAAFSVNAFQAAILNDEQKQHWIAEIDFLAKDSNRSNQ